MANSKTLLFQTHRRNLILSCAAITFISACGGGGGGSSEPSVTYTSVLSGVNEVSPVATIGSGTATATLFTSTRALTGSIQLTNLTATAAHIHQGASGANGSVIVTLTDQGGGKWAVPAGTVLTEAQAAAFTTNGLYFNVHTAANTSGEIRGQIPSVAIPTVTYSSVLLGANEVPPITSVGSGTGIATLVTSTRALIGSIQLTNLTATAAHIHQGASGANGSVIVTLTDQGGGKWAVPAGTVLTEAQAAAFTTNGLYFNVHTAANTSGEIRGQIPSGTQATPAPLPNTGY